MTKILVVDDNVDIVETTVALLRLTRYEAEGVATIGQVVPMLVRWQPDILLQDCHMPGLDLADHVSRVRSDPRFRGVRILLFTASIQSTDFWKELKADGLLRKPFDLDELQFAIERLTPHVRSSL